MELLLLSVAQLLLGLAFVGAAVLVWCAFFDWFADNRKLTNTQPRSTTSWCKEHEFFDTITEFRDDFN